VLGTRADVSFEAVEDTGLSLGLMFKDEGGFLLTIREDELEGNKLPKEFRVVSKKSGKQVDLLSGPAEVDLTLICTEFSSHMSIL
jgi:hypothetical protein